MSVNLKLVLAEALNELKKAEAKERATDADLDKMSKQSSKHHDWPSIKHHYSLAYDNYIAALELLNYCRRTGIDHKDQEMITFTAERMKTYMDRCEKLRTKENNVLTSVRDADNENLGEKYLKEGYGWGEEIFVHKRSNAIKGNTPIDYHDTLKDGAYYLQVKNYDDYSVAAPTIKVQLMVKGRTGSNVKQQKIIPAMTCWGKNIGVVSSADVMIRVISDGMLRSSQVEVTLRELIPPKDATELKEQLADTKMDSSWIDSLPALPGAGAKPAAGGGPQGGVTAGGGTLPPPNMEMPDLPPPDMNNYGFGLIMPEAGPGQHPGGPQQPHPGAMPPPGMPMIPPGPPGPGGPPMHHQDPYAGGGGPGPAGYGVPHPHPQGPGPDHSREVMPPPDPLGGVPVDANGSPTYPMSHEQQGSADLLNSLSVPGGSVGSPLNGGGGMGEAQPSSNSNRSVGVDELADLEVPYNAKRKSANTGVNGQPVFNPVYDIPTPGGNQQRQAPPAAAGGNSASGGAAPAAPRVRPPKPTNQPEIQKSGASLEERLARVKGFTDYYTAASAGDKAMAQAMTNPDKYLGHLNSCNPETKQLAEKVTKLPEPTELGMDDMDDIDLGDMELDMADLEAGNF